MQASLASAETWTLSGGAGGAVVRGGTGGCEGRQVVPPDDLRVDRIGACCERGVGIITGNRNQAFMATTSGKLLRYESALNRRDSAALKDIVDEKATIEPRPSRRDGFFGFYDAYNAKHRDLWIALDSCDVSIQKSSASPPDDTWVADCAAEALKDGTLAVFRSHFVWGGADGRLRSLGEVAVLRGFGGQL